MAERMAERGGKSKLGGSDAHALRSLGSVYTDVPGARNKDEFLAGLRLGRGHVEGGSGNFGRLTRDVLQICASVMEERPAARLLSPLLLAVPLVTLINYVTEDLFARRWESRWERWQGMERGDSTRGMRTAPGEASA
jgi:hypothetical protein